PILVATPSCRLSRRTYSGASGEERNSGVRGLDDAPLLFRAMTRSLAIVTGADAGYFPLLEGCLRSIRDKAPGRAVDLAVLDLGLEPAQRRWVEGMVDRVVEPGWDFDFPGRAETPRHF